MRWLHLDFHAPLASFGGMAIDAQGVIRDFPAQSMVTGLVANALGWDRFMGEEHQILQDRIVHGALWKQQMPLAKLVDYQTAKINKSDGTWTTRGEPATRAGGEIRGAHQRWRAYHQDLQVVVVMRLKRPDERPTLCQIAEALQRPARPLFIGRKPCLPSRPIFQKEMHGDTVVNVLREIAATLALGRDQVSLRGFWPEMEGTGGTIRNVVDERNWLSGLHGGTRKICEGTLTIEDGKS